MLAASARRAGFLPLVVDSFNDADLAQHAHAARCLPEAIHAGFHWKSLRRALDELAASAPSPPIGLLLGAGFEEAPALIRRLGERYALLGCSAESVRGAKDPATLFPLLTEMGIRHPDTRIERPADVAGWLTKRIGGSGGTHIHNALPRREGDTHADSPSKGAESPFPLGERVGVRGRPERSQQVVGPLTRQLPHGRDLPASPQGERQTELPPPRRYYQRRVEGRPISVMAVLSPRGEAVAFTRQWVEPAPRMPFRYGGAAGHLTLPEDLEAELVSIALPLGRKLGLRGLVSFDVLVGSEGPLLADVNPRPGATLDVLDDDAGTLFSAHVAACRGEDAASLLARGWRPRPRAAAYLYADRGPLEIADPAWPDWALDRPRPGSRIGAGQPVATVIAESTTPDAAESLCRHRLEALAEMLYGQSSPYSPAEHRR